MQCGLSEGWGEKGIDVYQLATTSPALPNDTGMQQLGERIIAEMAKSLWSLVVHLWPLIVLLLVISVVKLLLESGIYFDFRNRRLVSTARSVSDIVRASPTQFEHLCRLLFEKQGYRVIVTEPTNDGGIDIVGSKDGARIVAQCKRYSRKSVGRPAVQQLYGVMAHERAEKGFLITTSRFTGPAVDFARGKPIKLIGAREFVVWVNSFADGEVSNS